MSRQRLDSAISSRSLMTAHRQSAGLTFNFAQLPPTGNTRCQTQQALPEGRLPNSASPTDPASHCPIRQLAPVGSPGGAGRGLWRGALLVRHARQEVAIGLKIKHVDENLLIYRI